MNDCLTYHGQVFITSDIVKQIIIMENNMINVQIYTQKIITLDTTNGILPVQKISDTDIKSNLHVHAL